MKIGFIYQTDSHFKAVYQTSLRLKQQYQCEVSFYVLESEHETDISNIKLEKIDKKTLSQAESCNYLVCCLGGYLLNCVIRFYRNTDTQVISLFPGIVSHYQLDAFISRMNADQVWLNSQADYTIYSILCEVFKVKNNGVLYGMPWINLNIISESKSSQIKQPIAIFFEQTVLLDTVEKQVSFRKALDILFLNNQETTFLYKIRDNTNESFFLKLRKDLHQYNNVKVVTSICNSLFFKTTYYLTLSSSAIIEGVLANKKCHLLDKYFLDRDSLEFFTNSNLYLSTINYKLERTDTKVNDFWKSSRVCAPLSYVQLSSSKKTSQLKVKHRSLYCICYYILKIALRGRFNVVRIINQKQYLKNIQKSLEYISLEF